VGPSNVRLGIALTAAVLLGCGLTSLARADGLEAALREAMPKVIRYVHDHAYHSVLVLKFAVKKGGQAATMHASTRNTKVARSIEQL
jgi:hypothetical protein